MRDVKFYAERALGCREGNVSSHFSIVLVGRVFGQSERLFGWWFGVSKFSSCPLPKIQCIEEILPPFVRPREVMISFRVSVL